MKTIWSAFAFFIFATTCHSEVILKIKREDSFIAIVSDARIFINEDLVGKISNGNSLQLSTTAGVKTIKIDKTFSTGEFKKSFDLTEDSTYEIEIGPRGAMVAFALLGGLAAIADNVANKDSVSSDNGVFSVKKFEKINIKKINTESTDSENLVSLPSTVNSVTPSHDKNTSTQ